MSMGDSTLPINHLEQCMGMILMSSHGLISGRADMQVPVMMILLITFADSQEASGQTRCCKGVCFEVEFGPR